MELVSPGMESKQSLRFQCFYINTQKARSASESNDGNVMDLSRAL